MLTPQEKIEVVESGIHKKYGKIQKYVRLGRFDVVQDIQDEILNAPIELIVNGRKFFISQKQKQWRLVKRLKYMDELTLNSINSNLKIVFVTLTFNDEFLAQNNADSQRQAVRRYLSSQTIDYVANVDYGAKNGRRHYHAVCLISKNIDLKTWQEKCGLINVETVKKALKENKQAYRIGKYITKLANHALKDGTLNTERLIFRRKSKIDFTELLPF